MEVPAHALSWRPKTFRFDNSNDIESQMIFTYWIHLLTVFLISYWFRIGFICHQTSGICICTELIPSYSTNDRWSGIFFEWDQQYNCSIHNVSVQILWIYNCNHKPYNTPLSPAVNHLRTQPNPTASRQKLGETVTISITTHNCRRVML